VRGMSLSLGNGPSNVHVNEQIVDDDAQKAKNGNAPSRNPSQQDGLAVGQMGVVGILGSLARIGIIAHPTAQADGLFGVGAHADEGQAADERIDHADGVHQRFHAVGNLEVPPSESRRQYKIKRKRSIVENSTKAHVEDKARKIARSIIANGPNSIGRGSRHQESKPGKPKTGKTIAERIADQQAMVDGRLVIVGRVVQIHNGKDNDGRAKGQDGRKNGKQRQPHFLAVRQRSHLGIV